MHYSYTVYVRLLTLRVKPSDTVNILLRSMWRNKIVFSGTSVSFHLNECSNMTQFLIIY